MNLRVDLILPSEQRSASPIGLKAATRIVAAAIVLGVATYLFLTFMYIADMSSRLSAAEAKWNTTVPKQAAAVKLIQEATENVGIRDEIGNWSRSRIEWNGHLVALAKLVPTEVQLLDFSMQQEFQIVNSNTTARVCQLALSGRCSARGGERYVEDFKLNIERSHELSSLVTDVEVPKFAEDPKDRNVRIFQITAKCRPRAFQ